MVTDDVRNLKKSYNLLDYIEKVIRNSELEQGAKAAHMRRIEKRLDSIETTLQLITKHLGIS